MAEVELQATIDTTHQQLKQLEHQLDVKIIQDKLKVYQEEEQNA